MEEKGCTMSFFHHKNDECQRQQENCRILVNTTQETSNSFTSTVILRESMTSVSLPSKHWLAFHGDGVLQWSRVEIGHDGMPQPTRSAILTHDLSFHIHGKSPSYVQVPCRVSLYNNISDHDFRLA